MADIFGLDFGTTNTLASRIVVREGVARPIDYTDETDAPHPSVVAYQGDRVFAGREAYALLDRADSGVIGDAVRSPKSYLGSGMRLTVGGIRDTLASSSPKSSRTFEISLDKWIREREFDQAVMTIPVDMDGGGEARATRSSSRRRTDVHQLVQEPLAALYAYLRVGDELERRIAALGESPILVADWGGGTLDLTLARIAGRTLVQFGSRGEHRVGGDRFDELLRNLVRRRHAEKHRLRSLEPLQVGAAQRLLAACETQKKRLSDQDDALIYVAHYLATDGASANLEEEITKADLEREAAHLVELAMDGITAVLSDARIEDSEVGLVLLAGGMSRMPLIQHAVERRFGIERVPAVADSDRLIAHGAAWIAHDERRLQLAKPFELTLAGDHPAQLLSEGTDLPVDEDIYPERFPVFAVDPRDGRARFIFTRPLDPGRAQPLDARRIYGTLQLPVDEELGPRAAGPGRRRRFRPRRHCDCSIASVRRDGDAGDPRA